jgi:hypothetical protein
VEWEHWLESLDLKTCLGNWQNLNMHNRPKWDL